MINKILNCYKMNRQKADKNELYKLAMSNNYQKYSESIDKKYRYE